MQPPNGMSVLDVVFRGVFMRSPGTFSEWTPNAILTPFCRIEARTVQPLAGMNVLDVGCGGGLFSEALARLGANVTGIDTSATAIAVASAHAQADPAVASRTTYQNVTAEQLQQEGRSQLSKLHSARFYMLQILLRIMSLHACPFMGFSHAARYFEPMQRHAAEPAEIVNESMCAQVPCSHS